MMYSDRVRIQVLLDAGWDIKKIAIALNIHQATLYREVGRYLIGDSKKNLRYDANVAHLKRVLEMNY